MLPAAMATIPLEDPDTPKGTRLRVVVPLPSWPEAFDPQHIRPPPLDKAQLCDPPAATANSPLVRPTTCSGETRQ